MAAFPRGRFCWHELMTTDTDAAKGFYTQLVGWSTEAWPSDPSYTLWMNGKTPVGGLMTLPEPAKLAGAPPNWMPFVAVSDAHDLIRQVTDFGGKLLNGPSSVSTVGTYATLQDPQGATFAVLQPEGKVPGHDGPFRRGEFSWHELATTDPQAAWNFYEMLFGWEKLDSMDMGAAGSYDIFGRAGRMLGGIYAKPAEMPAPPNWMSYVMVPNADQASERLREMGGQVLNGPMEVPGGDRVAQCMDPQGAMIAVHSVAQAAAAPRPKKTKTTKKKAVKKKARKKSAAKKVAKKKTAKKSKAKAAKKAKKAKRKAAKKKRTTKKTARRKATKKKTAKKKTAKKTVMRRGKKKTAKKKASKKRRARKKR